MSVRAFAWLALALLAVPLAGCAEEAGSTGEPEEQTIARSFTIAPGRGLEFKLLVNEGDAFTYAWNASHAVFFDFHGDRNEDGSDFVSHEKGAAAEGEGAFTAPFTGRHGWYWENRGRADVTITLDVDGTFAVIGRTGG